MGEGRGEALDLIPVNLNRPVVRLVGPGDHLDERGLARAVLAEQRMDLSGLQLKVHPAQSTHPGKRFRNLPEGKQRCVGSRHVGGKT